MVGMRFAAASLEEADQAGRDSHAETLATANKIDVHVGRRLRELRKELGISQSRLGRQLGLTFSQVQKYEKGSNRIGAGRLYQIAAMLEVPVQYFFEGLDGGPGREPNPASGVAVTSDAEAMRALVIRIAEPDTRQALISLASSLASS